LAGQLEDRERAFAHELTFGVTRLRGRLDFLIAPHVHRGIGRLEPTVLEILRLGAYQLLYMGSVPDFAAVSESVELARDVAGQRSSGLINAVLRRISEAGGAEDTFPDPDEDIAGFLTSWGSHPDWLVKRWLARWPAEGVRAFVEANNERPSINLVPLDVGAAEAVLLLARAGIEAVEVGEGSRCVRLAARTSPRAALEALPHSVVQDPAADLVATYADVPRGTKVADLCAAPGGKAIAVSDRPAHTLAADRSEARIRMVRENARRTERPIGCVVADARRPPLAHADVVLLDVPCSGTGTLRRHPDARWRLDPASIGELQGVQRDMLASAAVLIPPGGLLVYSTCTLEREENEDQIDWFLETHADFGVEATDAVPGRYLDARDCLLVMPQDTGFDGAFAARLRRQA
jgi:16S rRNA (cytosine967-C5)-methyltransferase